MQPVAKCRVSIFDHALHGNISAHHTVMPQQSYSFLEAHYDVFWHLYQNVTILWRLVTSYNTFCLLIQQLFYFLNLTFPVHSLRTCTPFISIGSQKAQMFYYIHYITYLTLYDIPLLWYFATCIVFTVCKFWHFAWCSGIVLSTIFHHFICT